jgi:hypothetical protein
MPLLEGQAMLTGQDPGPWLWTAWGVGSLGLIPEGDGPSQTLGE